jgi:DNA-3-methyladenine glycosylase
LAALGREFYERNTQKVAKELLGKILVHGKKKGKIVETEAYLGLKDPGAKGYRKVKNIPEALLKPAGHAFVYFTYGNHWMLNVNAKKDRLGAVLIRAVEPLANVSNTNGPGKLTKAFGIDKYHNGADITCGCLRIENSKERPKIVTTTRIGLSRGEKLKLRFYIKGNEFVSKP